MSLYEKVYTTALEISHILFPISNIRPSRASIDGVVFEYLLPKHYTTAIIVLDGLPRIPELSGFINLLYSWGYAVFFPRLKGTWESTGEFLNHNPIEDVQNLANLLRNGTTIDDTPIKVNTVVVLGASFGGIIALGVSACESVSSSIALSPVYAMSAVAGIETLYSFIKDAYPGAYRCSEDNWHKLLRDEIISLRASIEHQQLNATKCVIVAGENDCQIDITELKNLSDAYGIRFQTLPTGHLAFHKDSQLIRPLLYHLLNECH
jgi:esterase/lipase